MDPTTNPVTNLKMEDDNTPLAEGAAEQARKSSRRKRKFKNKSKSKSKSKDHITEELPKGKQRRPHRKSLNLKPLIEESASKLRETKALDNLKLISMQLEDTSRMGTKNEFDSVFSSEFNRFEAESEKRDLRAARWKEQTNMLPYQHQYARLTNYNTPLDTHTDSEPLSRLSPEKVYTSEAKANTEFYDRSPDYSNDFNRTNYRQYLTTLGSKTLTPKENSVSTPSSNHSQTNIHNFSFNVQNSPLEENSKTIPERPNVPNPNILAFGVSQEPSHQNTGRILQKIRARTPDPTLPKIRTSRSPVDDRNEFLITKSVNTESIQNKKRKKDSETYPEASDNLSPLDRSWENLLANAELYSKKANPTDGKSAELKAKKETSMGSTYYLLNFPASIGKGPEPQSTTEGSMQPKYQRLHSKRDRTIVRDANGYRRPSGVPPRYQKLSSALKEIDSTYVYGAQPVNLQSLNEGIITFLKETYTQAPPHQRKGSLQKDNDFTPDSLPRSLSPLGDRQNFTPTKQTPTRTRVMSRRYESGITTERTNSVDVCKNQSTQIEVILPY